MDISIEADVVAAVDTILAQTGGVDVLINNAGFGLYGPMEEIGMDEARYQFEVNVFGPARLTQLLLPTMRARKAGKIVNITSMGGKIYTPLGSWYHDVVLTTYPLIARDREVLLSRDWHMAVLDEAQTIKNPDAATTRWLRDIKARHRFCLTGTPMENHLGEVWSIMGGYHDGLQSDAVAGPVRELLLFQIATDSAMHWCWGDTGAYYVFVDPDALKALNFSSATMILECH